jgi:hypothetical protein
MLGMTRKIATDEPYKPRSIFFVVLDIFNLKSIKIHSIMLESVHWTSIFEVLRMDLR